MADRGLVIVFSGPSGVGKGTVRRNFENSRQSVSVAAVSMTTRAQRPVKWMVSYFSVRRRNLKI